MQNPNHLDRMGQWTVSGGQVQTVAFRDLSLQEHHGEYARLINLPATGTAPATAHEMTGASGRDRCWISNGTLLNFGAACRRMLQTRLLLLQLGSDSISLLMSPRLENCEQPVGTCGGLGTVVQPAPPTQVGMNRSVALEISHIRKLNSASSRSS